ncbi:MAG: DUF1987 domain-containing protein [Raineya sp.]|jgi:hypothetical protein|nr:DUF1987 domain-containing protein [Raineya sp.]
MLTPLYLEKTEYSPEVILDCKQGIFQIKGYFFVEDSIISSYKRIIDWLEIYAKSPNPSTTFCFYLSWVDDKGHQILIQILKLLKEIPSPTMEWYTSKDDEDVRRR